jgi:hypothetical protein
VVHGELTVDARFVSRPQACERGSRFGRGQFATHPTEGELGEEAMQPTDGLGAQGDEFFTPV